MMPLLRQSQCKLVDNCAAGVYNTCPGNSSCSQILSKFGAFSIEVIQSYISQTLEGLNYLHDNNIMHRDIKGANILLTETADVKLADFGVSAQITQTLGKRKSFIGTPYWMAPEVAAVERKGGYNHLCDIWAVGVSAMELAELHPPLWDLRPVLQALFRLPRDPAPRLAQPKKWSVDFVEWLAGCLQKEPERRIAVCRGATFNPRPPQRMIAPEPWPRA